MIHRLFVGNVPHSASEETLKEFLGTLGYVTSFAQIIRDRVTGHSRGFGFVEVHSEKPQKAVIEHLNEKRLQGRVLTVNAAVPRTGQDRRHERGDDDNRHNV